jgi:hypothetical protein
VLVNKPLADFIMDCNLIFDALRGPSKRRGDPVGVVEASDAIFDTEAVF